MNSIGHSCAKADWLWGLASNHWGTVRPVTPQGPMPSHSACSVLSLAPGPPWDLRKYLLNIVPEEKRRPQLSTKTWQRGLRLHKRRNALFLLEGDIRVVGSTSGARDLIPETSKREGSGTVIAYCNLELLASSDPPVWGSQSSGMTGMSYRSQPQPGFKSTPPAHSSVFHHSVQVPKEDQAQEAASRPLTSQDGWNPNIKKRNSSRPWKC
ncbi:hypothetical protein H8958_020714 [Nasalis larvatus]